MYKKTRVSDTVLFLFFVKSTSECPAVIETSLLDLIFVKFPHLISPISVHPPLGQRIVGETFQGTPGCPLAVPLPRSTHITHSLSTH